MRGTFSDDSVFTAEVINEIVLMYFKFYKLVRSELSNIDFSRKERCTIIAGSQTSPSTVPPRDGSTSSHYRFWFRMFKIKQYY